jgi:2-polyprenyl-3-methyl-5-hydroxy-6-metoxy-1,4-benzoquinol methylase
MCKLTDECWSQIKKFRKELPNIWRLPRIEDYESFALRYIKKTDAVLDIGCGDGRYLREYLLPFGHKGKYVGMDTDNTLSVDFPLYHSLDEIIDRFNVVLMFDVIEHLHLKQFFEYIIVIKRLLQSGGRLLISTPNVYSLRYLHKDVTHITFYPHMDLYGILRSLNFRRVSIYRAEETTNFLARLRALYYRLVDMDFCGNIFVSCVL